MSLRKLAKLRHALVFRLTFWYAGIFTVSSFVAFLLFYFLISTAIRDKIDRDLLERAEKFSTLLVTNGIDAVRRVAIVESQAAGEKKIFFRLLTRNGEVFSSSNMSYWKDIDIQNNAVRGLVNGSGKIFDTILFRERKDEVRILYDLIGPGVIIQLGQSMEDYAQFIEAFKNIFVSTMSFLVVLAAFIGWFMSKKALSGLGEVTKIARRISGGTLDERVPVNARGDEIDLLAKTFNQMLDRIQTLIIGIREMSDNIAHDLKSPVTRIRGIAEVTLTTGTSVRDFESMASNIVEECDRLLDMINTMLVISETEAGADNLRLEELDLAKVARNACDLFQPVAEDNGIKLTCDLPESLVLSGDIRMIQRMIANLLDNTVKYTPAGGEVYLLLSSEESEKINITVKDSGVGISEEDLPHIFERFYRCDPSRSKSGAGLGLSLALAIVRAHRGQIHVESKPGEGTIFSVTLPAKPYSESRSSKTVKTEILSSHT